MKKKCLIISGGDFCKLNTVSLKADLIIACDKGAQYAADYGIVPDVIIGDFDSCDISFFKNNDSFSGISDDGVSGCNKKPFILKYPVKKDDTDTMLAIKYALNEGCDYISIICAFGGRFDHTFANIQSGAYIAENGGTAEILSDDTFVLITGPGETVIPEKQGWSLSCFSLNGSCEDVSINGTKFDVSSVSINSTFPIGVSNVWKPGQNAVFSHKKGILMIVCSKLKPFEHI